MMNNVRRGDASGSTSAPSRASSSYGDARFDLLLLEEAEDYLADFTARLVSFPRSCVPEAAVSSSAIAAPGSLRICSKSLVFDSESLPVVLRLPFKFITAASGVHGDEEELHVVDGANVSSIATMRSRDDTRDKGGRGTRNGAASRGRDEGLVVSCSACIAMRCKGREVPYETRKLQPGEGQWVFELTYARVDDEVLPLVRTVMDVHGVDAAADRDKGLRDLQRRREDAQRFDVSLLASHNESILCELHASRRGHLTREPGVLVVTDEALYFQPLTEPGGCTSSRMRIGIRRIAAAARRRARLRPIAVEVFLHLPQTSDGGGGVGDAGAAGGGGSVFGNGGGGVRRAADDDESDAVGEEGSLLYALRNETDRETLLKALGSVLGTRGAAMSGVLEASGDWLRRITAAWQHGALSNFDYLLYLNLAAGRSSRDVSQYPVFPWVIRDYESESIDLDDERVYRDLSKPVGALNSRRLALLRARMNEMPREEKFLYGTHYSTPGYVLYWLVRTEPAAMLRLQCGRYDDPDRLFHSLRESWESVNTNPADVKELIPEFYTPSASHAAAFLLNTRSLPLGKRQNGEMVGDVRLPPWSHGDALEVLRVHRRALEGKHVSRHLHEWIDLIFGSKQRGQAADDADNVFHPLTYEGGVDVATIENETERIAVEMQIDEFGQTPRQLFTRPHPKRYVDGTTEAANVDGGDISAAASDAGTTSAPAPQVVTNVIQSSWQSQQSRADGPSTADAAGGHWKTNGSEGKRDGGTSNAYMQLVETILGVVAPSQAGGFAPLALEDERRRALSSGTSPPSSPMMMASKSRNADGDIHDGTLVSSSTFGIEAPRLSLATMRLSRRLRLHRGGVAALGVSLYAGNESSDVMLYSCGHEDGTVKVHGCSSQGSLVRSTSVSDLPLSCMSLAKSSVQSMMGFGARSSHPVVLVGSYDNCVHAYSVEYGRVLGSMAAHDDAVSSVLLPDVGRSGCLRCSDSGWAGASTGALATSGWDGTIRLWDVEEGRGTWGAARDKRFVISEMEHECALLSLDAAVGGSMLVAGAEDARVVSWDPRAGPRGAAWTSPLNSGPVHSVIAVPGAGHYVLAAGDAGEVHLLDVRRNGAEVRSAICGEDPLRCVDSDGRYAVLGSDDGHIYLWDIFRSGMSDAATAGTSGVGSDDDTPATERLEITGCGGVSTLCLVGDVGSRSDRNECTLIAGCSDGSLALFFSSPPNETDASSSPSALL